MGYSSRTEKVEVMERTMAALCPALAPLRQKTFLLRKLALVIWAEN